MSDIRLLDDPAGWNEALLTLQPNTFLQSAEWAALQARHGATVFPLVIYDGHTLRGMALWLAISSKRGRFLLCPHGPVFPDEAAARHYLPELIAYSQELARKHRAAVIRIAPLLTTSPSNTDLFAQLGFRPSPLHVHTELTWILDLTPPEEQLLRGMRKTTRQSIQRAQASPLHAEVVNNNSVIDRFWPLYQATKIRHRFVPFSRQFLQDQFDIFRQAEQAYAVFVRQGDQDVAAGIFMQFGRTVFYHHGASLKLPASLPASHLVQWQSIQEAKKRGAARYNFWGIAPANKSRHPFTGITVFKTGFGGYSVDYLHAQDLPLSWRYWPLWTVETWRKFRRGF